MQSGGSETLPDSETPIPERFETTRQTHSPTLWFGRFCEAWGSHAAKRGSRKKRSWSKIGPKLQSAPSWGLVSRITSSLLRKKSSMRQVSRSLFLLSLSLLLTGCTSFDPTRFWKYNRGENVMNDDGYFSIPVAEVPAASTQSTALPSNE